MNTFSKAVGHLQNISIKDEYETPEILFDLACCEYEIFPKIDVCATFKNSKCEKFYSIETDALLENWDEDFFMNPPYSKIKIFMKKAFEESRKNNVNGLILTYSKTDTQFWHNYVEKKAEVHFIKGRIKFFFNGIKTKYPAPYPSCFIIYRKKN